MEKNIDPGCHDKWRQYICAENSLQFSNIQHRPDIKNCRGGEAELNKLNGIDVPGPDKRRLNKIRNGIEVDPDAGQQIIFTLSRVLKKSEQCERNDKIVEYSWKEYGAEKIVKSIPAHTALGDDRLRKN